MSFSCLWCGSDSRRLVHANDFCAEIRDAIQNEHAGNLYGSFGGDDMLGKSQTMGWDNAPQLPDARSDRRFTDALRVAQIPFFITRNAFVLRRWTIELICEVLYPHHPKTHHALIMGKVSRKYRAAFTDLCKTLIPIWGTYTADPVALRWREYFLGGALSEDSRVTE